MPRRSLLLRVALEAADCENRKRTRPGMTSAIQTDALAKKFRRVNALKGLTLNIPLGSVYALVGPNGAGKTTAIKILMNIIRPTGGHAEVLGIASTRMRGRRFESIGYVSENQELPE